MSERQRHLYERSGLTGIELSEALLGLDALLQKRKRDKELNLLSAGPDSDSTSEEQMEEDRATANLQEAYDLLRKAYSATGDPNVPLTESRTKFAGYLSLKAEGMTAVVEKTDKLGENEHWSATGLLRHLKFLERLVPSTNETTARLWINAFFYRAAAILSGDRSMVMSVEQVVPATTPSDSILHSVSGAVGWTVVTSSDPDLADAFRDTPILTKMRDDTSTFYATEAKVSETTLESHIPQTVGEMCGVARAAGKTAIRGALTNGRNWIFLVAKFDTSDGITYKRSPTFSIKTSSTSLRLALYPFAISSISAILAHWMVHSHEGLGEDDYFEYANTSSKS